MSVNDRTGREFLDVDLEARPSFFYCPFAHKSLQL
jgi:hypothetical protein